MKKHIMLIILCIAGLLAACQSTGKYGPRLLPETAGPVDSGELKKNGAYNEYGTKYPVPGFRNLPWHIDSTKLEQRYTARYKAFKKWAEDMNVDVNNEELVPHPKYTYTIVTGPGGPVESKGLQSGTFTFKPGATYGIGSHYSWELYVVISGEGEFYNYDKTAKVKPGSFILTRPFDVHAIKNTGKTNLELQWFWWQEDANAVNWDTGGLPFQPALCWKDKGLEPCVKPTLMPEPLQGDDRFRYMYADEKANANWDGKAVDPKDLKANGKYNEFGTKYPVPGFRNLPWHVNAQDLKQHFTARFKAYKAWALENDVTPAELEAKPHPGYTYTYPVGPGAPLETRHFQAGTFTFQPGSTYGIGSHPAWELYIVNSGEGEFFNYDRTVKATPGTWIVTRPYDVHAIRNLGTEPLEITWVWWRESPDTPNWDTGGLPFQPEICWKAKGLHPCVQPTKQPTDLQGDERFVLID